MNRCRDCGTTALHPEKRLCESCKKLADERQKKRHNATQKARYHKKSEHECATSGCSEMLIGQAVYCKKCRNERQLASQRKCWEAMKYTYEPKPQGPVTTYQSMHDLTADLKLKDKLGFKSYGELSTWREQQRGARV